jgi:hypothetical protein
MKQNKPNLQYWQRKEKIIKSGNFRSRLIVKNNYIGVPGI